MPDDVKPNLASARVARTQAQIVASARDLFLAQGYVATTLAQVAERAGVAPRTVYVRFATKAELFRRVVDEALTGDPAPIDIEHRPRTQVAMTARTLAERLDAFIGVSMGIIERAGALFEVASEAEGLEPQIAAAADAGRRATAELCAAFWTRARDDGLLPPDADPTTLAITTDVLVCADTTVHLRRTRRWTAEEHSRWLRSALGGLTAAG